MADSPKSEADRGRKTVLVVEDDEDVRVAVLECLAEAGYSAVATRHGVEAIYYLTHVPRLPDLILLDLSMPVMDGWTLRKKLDQHPEWSKIPVVVYSANTRLKPIMATVVLTKPISMDRLVTIVTQQIEKEKKP